MEDKIDKDDENKNRDRNSFWRSDDPGHFGDGKGPEKNDRPPQGGRRRPALLSVVFILLVGFFIYQMFFSGIGEKSVTYTRFRSDLDGGKISQVVIRSESDIEYMLKDDMTQTVFKTTIPYYDSSLLADIESSGAVLTGAEAQVSFLTILLEFLPIILFVVFTIMLLRMSSSNGQMMGYGKSHARQYGDKDPKVKFADVAGQKEAKFELQEVVEFLKNPARYKEIGAKIPKGVLLVGPPGTGKTLLAKAVAGEAGVSFFHTSGSDFVEMFVGMGAARVRDLFDQGRKHAPCILFIDELDAVGRSRGSGLGGGHDEREQTLNQMLVEMDGFDTSSGVIVIAATNRPDVLDPALLRPGRFDRQVVVDLPDVDEREAILKIHAAKVKLEQGVDLRRIARATPGSSGADLANLVNEAALFAARDSRKTVGMQDFEQARDKMVLGVARKSRVLKPEEKKSTACHEAGHALLYYHLDNLDPLHKVTIIPHGRALGVTMSLPEEDKYCLNRSALLSEIKVCMGGYIAEDLVYGQTTTGTSNDMKQATELARRMVTEFGMSELGFISLGSEDEPLFLGREIAQHKSYSEGTASAIDAQIRKILDSCMADARSILTEHRDELDKLTDALVERETMDDSEIRELLGFEAIGVKNSDITD